MRIVNVGPYKVGPGQPMLLFAGPCVLEGYEHSLAIGQEVKRICEKLGMPYVFKASYDKAEVKVGKTRKMMYTLHIGE